MAEEQQLPAAESPTQSVTLRYLPESDPEEGLEEDWDEGLLLIQLDKDPYLLIRHTAKECLSGTQSPTPIPLREFAERVLGLLLHHNHFSHILITTFPLYTVSGHYLYHHHHPLALLMLRDLWDPELLGLDREMHYHLMFMRLRCLICVYRFVRGVSLLLWSWIRGRESSAAGTARQVGPTTASADLYGFADMLEAAPGRRMSRELGYGIRDTWDDLVGSHNQEIAHRTTLEGVNQRVIELSSTVDQEDEIIYSQLDDARYDRALLRARVNMLESDRPFHRRTAVLMEEEARLSRAAWAQVEIVELQAADQRRQTVISELLKADYRRQRQLVEALKIVKSLKTQMIELQTQQGPAKDPAEPELPEEASSSS
ncbi:hypothetical protein Tco_1104032 [Tanacetum coccineum]